MFYEIVSNKCFYLLAKVSHEERLEALKRAQDETLGELRIIGEGGFGADKWSLVLMASILFFAIFLLIQQRISKKKA